MRQTIRSLAAAVQNILKGRRAFHGVLQGILIQGCVQGINVAAGIMTARLLGPEGRGAFVALSIWPNVLGAVVIAGLPTAITYHLQHQQGEERQALTAALILGLLVALAGVAIGHVAVPLALTDWPDTVIIQAATLTWFVLLNALNAVCRPFLLARSNYWVYHLMYIGPPAFYLASLAAVYLLIGLTPLNSALCLVVSGAPATLMGLVLIIRRNGVGVRGTGSWIRRLVRYGAVAFQGEVLIALFSSADRVLLARVVTPHELGLYSVAASLAGLLAIMTTVTSQFLLRAQSRATPERRAEVHDHAIRFVFWSVTAAAVPLYLLGGPAIQFVFGADFTAAIPTYHLLLLSMIFGCVSVAANQTALSLGRPFIVSIGELIAATVATVGILGLTPRMGLIGAGITVVTAAGLRLSFTLLYLWLRFNLPVRSILPGRRDLAFLRNALS